MISLDYYYNLMIVFLHDCDVAIYNNDARCSVQKKGASLSTCLSSNPLCGVCNWRIPVSTKADKGLVDKTRKVKIEN
jgi:plasmid rolling circle replication initiator protein Rep